MTAHNLQIQAHGINKEIEKMKSQIEVKKKYKPVTNRDYRIVEENNPGGANKAHSSEGTQGGSPAK